MAIHELKEQIARLPEQPGVYLYFNAGGDTIYVGKARALRDRVRNYLGAYGSDPKTDALLDEVTRLDVIVTDSVVEALALENNLIKQRTPKYNILLRDDKNYPYLQLTTNEACPRVLVARRVERDGSFYAGPFLPARFARRTMALTHRLFGIRSCNEVITGERGRPCLEYDIGRCIAPCVREICSAERYGAAVQHTRLFLEGRNNEAVAAHYDALETLRLVLGLPAIPRRIECFDVSTIQGAETVASMVVCEDGRMKKSEYRKYRIRGLRSSVYGR